MGEPAFIEPAVEGLPTNPEDITGLMQIKDQFVLDTDANQVRFGVFLHPHHLFTNEVRRLAWFIMTERGWEGGSASSGAGAFLVLEPKGKHDPERQG